MRIRRWAEATSIWAISTSRPELTLEDILKSRTSDLCVMRAKFAVARIRLASQSFLAVHPGPFNNKPKKGISRHGREGISYSLRDEADFQ
jgi:hypothetical protein